MIHFKINKYNINIMYFNNKWCLIRNYLTTITVLNHLLLNIVKLIHIYICLILLVMLLYIMNIMKFIILQNSIHLSLK